MALKPLRLLAVGQLKAPHFKQAAEHYLERLRRWRALTVTLVRDGASALPAPQRNAEEGQRLLAQLTPQDVLICLDERGTAMGSPDFARFLERLSENATRTPCFVLGGAYGLDVTVREAATHILSLGPMTLTHELARVVLLEQLYRAECILRKVPYHH